MDTLNFRLWSVLYGSLPYHVIKHMVHSRPLRPTMSPNDPSREAWESLGVC